MITLLNKDREIFDLPNRVVDIIDEYQRTGTVIINTNNEGLCLDAANFYSTLDYICNKFNINKSKITIQTNNVEEQHLDYNIIINGNHWIDKSKVAYSIPLTDKASNLKTIGCFLGKPNWHRLILAAWLFNNYKNQCIQTMHFNPTDERHCIDSELTKINIEAGNELESVVTFIKNCPITTDEGFIDYTIGPDKHYNIINQYSKIFADLVVETYISGNTFFPTEKTFRPIIARAPFIVMGPRGYLENLRRMGFKTFSQYWDEDYDDYTGYTRLSKIKTVLLELFSWDQHTLFSNLNNMNDIIEHNYIKLKQLNKNSVKLNVN